MKRFILLVIIVAILVVGCVDNSPPELIRTGIVTDISYIPYTFGSSEKYIVEIDGTPFRIYEGTHVYAVLGEEATVMCGMGGYKLTVCKIKKPF